MVLVIEFLSVGDSLMSDFVVSSGIDKYSRSSTVVVIGKRSGVSLSRIKYSFEE